MKHKTGIAGIITVLLTALLLTAGMSVTAFGADEEFFPNGVDYIDETGITQHLDRKDFKVYGIDVQLSEPLETGWYVIWSTGSNNQRVEVTGDAKILLMADQDEQEIAHPTMKFNSGIHVPEGSTLSIYGQTKTEEKSGKLIAAGSEDNAGIGGNYSSNKTTENCGTINIYGGVVEATGGSWAAGIGGGLGYAKDWTRRGGNGGTFYMNGGWVYATGGSHAAGLGGGYRGNSGSGGITIDGGYLEARGGDNKASSTAEHTGGAGIGGGEGRHTQYYGETGGCAENITINGGVVRAYGTDGGAGIGGGGYGNGSLTTGNWIRINGGNVYAEGSDGGSGIGGGDAPLNNWHSMGAGANVEITGGVIYAKGGKNAAGIGSAWAETLGSGKTIIKGNAAVTARGGDYAAGIGTGNHPSTLATNAQWNELYDIQISEEAKVEAYGGNEGAGIGCGNEGKDSAGRKGKVSISENAEVTAVGGKYGAGIGGGDQQVNGRVTISGGTVTAQGGYGAAGIGMGDDCTDEDKFNSSGNIYISGGTVNSTGGEFGAGIGGADGSNFIPGPETGDEYGKIKITGGKVTAKAKKEAAGIGGGNYWTAHGGGNGCDVSIDLKNEGDFVLASSDNDSAPIGHGDGGDSDGTLTLGSVMSVKKSEYKDIDYAALKGLTPVDANDRVSNCQNDSNKSVLIQYCKDKYADALYYIWLDNEKHREICSYCDYSKEEDHIIDAASGNCSKCGGDAENITITFKEGASQEVTVTKHCRSWDDYVLPECDESKVPSGKRFAGWNEAGDTDLDNVTPAGETVTAKEDKTWVAMYGDEVTISFKPGTGSGTMSPRSAVDGTWFQLPDHEFDAPEGGVFGGWSDGSSIFQPDKWYRLNGNVTFTAQWEGHKHEMEHYNAVPANCTDSGSREYWECKGCKKFFKDAEGNEAFANKGDVVIPAKGHFWDAPVYNWSDDNSQVTASVMCLNDNSHTTEETVKTRSEKTGSTCYKEGETVYTARFESKVFKTQTKTVKIEKKAHNWFEWADDPEDDKKQTRSCQNEGCTAVETRNKDHEHNLEKVNQVDPTCERSGVKAYWKCVNGEHGDGCGKWYADANANQEIEGDTDAAREASWKIPATGHKRERIKTEIQTEPTCTENGSAMITVRCLNGGGHTMEPEFQVLSALGHDWDSGTIIKEVTCTSDGLKRCACLRCGKTEDIVIPAVGGSHEWGEWKTTRPATPTTPGERQRACEKCGVVEQGTIAPQPAAEATVNVKTVNAAVVQQALQAAGNPSTLILGKKVKKISKGALAGTSVKTLVVTSKKLKKKSVKGSLKGSSVTTVRVKVGKAKTNKRYARKYRKIFTKKNAGKKVKVRKY